MISSKFGFATDIDSGFRYIKADKDPNLNVAYYKEFTAVLSIERRFYAISRLAIMPKLGCFVIYYCV